MTFADFPIVYNGITFMVDPFAMCYNSQRFRNIFHPGYAGFSQVTINGNFQPLSIDIFCSICQGQQVNVPPECINDVATLARVFVAEPVVSSIIGQITANANGSIIFENKKSINQAYDDFEWLRDYSQLSENQSPEPTTLEAAQQSGFNQVSQNPNEGQQESNPNLIPDQSQISTVDSAQPTEEAKEPSQNSDAKNQELNLADPEEYYEQEPTTYDVQLEKKVFKCDRYSLLQNDNVIATAKTRSGSIVLNIGVDAHFKQMDQSAADIQRFSFLNVLTIEKKKYEIKFFRNADTGYMTLHTIANLNGDDKLLLTGLKKLPKEKIFGTLKVMDENHPCNIFFKNGQTALTFSQNSKTSFTIESHLKAPMIFIFALFMCAVTGPHTQISNEPIKE